MKKLLIPLLLISTISFGQARLGYTKGQLIDDYESSRTKHEIMTLDDNIECVYTKLTSGSYIYHYFDKNTHLSTSAAFMFVDKLTKAQIIKTCNEKYTKIGKNHWQWQTMDISLRINEKEGYEYFWFYTR